MSAQDARERRSHLNMGPERSTPSQPSINMHRHNKPAANVSTKDTNVDVTSNHPNDDPLGKRSEASRRVLARASEFLTS